MDEPQRSPRRRRGRRGRRNAAGEGASSGQSSQPPGPPPGPPGPSGPPGAPPQFEQPDAAQPPAAPGEGERRRPPRQDTRRDRRGEPPAPRADAPDGARSRIHRNRPEERSRPDERAPRDRRPRERDGNARPARERDMRPRSYEAPVPQDERSVELGASFREAQTAVRDARKTIDRRKAEQSDEPQWLLDELAAAERAFEEAATAWSEHLTTTGRKIVRR